MEKNLISIIVPVFNVENYITKCVRSLMNQSYQSLEIILIDDGSSDYSLQICEKLARQDGRIVVLHQENRGLSAARNAGLKVAKGTYIGFVDSDDYVHPEMYQELLVRITEQNADVSICNYREVNEDSDDKVEDSERCASWKLFCTNEDKIQYQFKENYVNAVVVWNKLYKRSLWKGIEYPEGRIYEDEAITYKILYRAEKLVYSERALYYYVRRKKGSVTSEAFSKKRLMRLDSICERMRFYCEKEEWNYFYETLFVYKTDLLKVMQLIRETDGFSDQILSPYRKKYVYYVMNYLKKCNCGPKKQMQHYFFAYLPKTYYCYQKNK